MFSKHSITYTITLCLYALSLYFLFFVVQLLRASIAVLGLLVSIHFAVMSITHSTMRINTRNRILWVLVSGTLIAFTAPYNPVLMILAYLVFHLGLYFYIIGKNSFLRTTTPHIWYYANTSMYLFTVFFTISLGILMIGISWKIPFDCQTIEDGYSKTVSFFTAPVEQWYALITHQSNTDSWYQNLLLQTGQDDSGIAALFVMYKNQLLHDVFSERKQLNTDICRYLFDNIQIQLQKPWFQLAILFPLFLILSPVIRIILYIVSVCMMFVTRLLIKIGVYRKHTTTKEVTEWY